MPDIFAGSRIKLERANAHINELVAEIDSFRQSDPYKVVLQEEPRTGMQTLCSEVLRTVPLGWSGIIGDAVHNARCALDLMLNDLVSPANRGTARFPIRATPDPKWASGIPDIKGLAPAIQQKVADLQPYNTGDMTVRDLHILDIEDKHKVLVALASATAFHNIRATQVGTGGTLIAGDLEIDTREVGVKSLGLRVHKSLEFHDNFDIAMDIVFGDTDALPGAPIVPALQSFVEAVERILDDFRPPPIV